MIFNPEDVSLSFSFEIIDDEILEEEESFLITIGIPINPPLGLMLGMQPSATVSIIDNEGLCVSL